MAKNNKKENEFTRFFNESKRTFERSINDQLEINKAILRGDFRYAFKKSFNDSKRFGKVAGKTLVAGGIAATSLTLLAPLGIFLPLGALGPIAFSASIVKNAIEDANEEALEDLRKEKEDINKELQQCKGNLKDLQNEIKERSELTTNVRAVQLLICNELSACTELSVGEIAKLEIVLRAFPELDYYKEINDKVVESELVGLFSRLTGEQLSESVRSSALVLSDHIKNSAARKEFNTNKKLKEFYAKAYHRLGDIILFQ